MQITNTPTYAAELHQRMRDYGITQDELSRTIGINPTTTTRWFTKNPKRRVTPNRRSMARIEAAMAVLIERRTALRTQLTLANGCTIQGMISIRTAG